jgi:hypothetical protein
MFRRKHDPDRDREGRRRRDATPPVKTPSTPARRARVVVLAAVVWALSASTAVGWLVFRPDDLAELRAARVAPVTESDRAVSEEVADLIGERDHYISALAQAEGRASDLEIELGGLRAASSGIPAGDLPVVSFVGAGYADTALREEFDASLVTPLQQDAFGLDRVVVAIIVEVPQADGEPFSYAAVYLDGIPLWSEFGLRGTPLPTWSASCVQGC